MPERYPAEIKDRVIELYRAGKKGEAIAAEVGIPRPSVYLILKQRGIAPSRQKAMQSRQLSVEQALEMVADRDRTIGRLEGQIEMLQAQVERQQAQIQVLLSSRNDGVANGV